MIDCQSEAIYNCFNYFRKSYRTSISINELLFCIQFCEYCTYDDFEIDYKYSV